jgi:type II secretory pathway component PulF
VFTGVYNRFAGNVASSSFAYIQFAYGVGWFALVITLLLAALLVFCLVTARTTKGRSRLSGLFELLPLTSSASRKLAVARFTSTLSIFIASGVDVDTALDAADGMVDHGETHEKIQKCKDSMSKGSGLATAIFNEKVFEPLYGRMLLSGARSGNLEQVLARLSDLFTQDANNALDSLIDSIEPLLAGFLTISVGVTLLSVMLPLIGILGTIG